MALRLLLRLPPRSDRELGTSGESMAARYMQLHGYRILARNWRCRSGEIDIVCEGKDHLCVFVEVKSSYRLGVFPPEVRVQARKQAKLRSLARIYLRRQKLEAACRFDVVSVWWENGKPQIKHIENAF